MERCRAELPAEIETEITEEELRGNRKTDKQRQRGCNTNETKTKPQQKTQYADKNIRRDCRPGPLRQKQNRNKNQHKNFTRRKTNEKQIIAMRSNDEATRCGPKKSK